MPARCPGCGCLHAYSGGIPGRGCLSCGCACAPVNRGKTCRCCGATDS